MFEDVSKAVFGAHLNQISHVKETVRKKIIFAYFIWFLKLFIGENSNGKINHQLSFLVLISD